MQTELDPAPHPGAAAAAGGPAVRHCGASPIVPVRRVPRTAAFYTDILGFELAEQSAEGTYALVRRGETSVILLDLGDAQALRATANYFSAYFWVENVADYWREVEPRLASLGERRVRPLFLKADGRAEFHVRDPDGFMLFFGEAPA